MPGLPRVLMLSAYYFPFQGGTETHARRAARYLTAHGGHVTIVTKRDERGSPDRDVVDQSQVYRIGPRGPRSGFRKWAMIPAAVAKIVALRREFDVIYCPGYQGIGLAAVAAGRLLGRPVVLRSGNLGVLAGGQWDAPLARWHIPATIWPVRALKRLVARVYMLADAFACNCRENEREAIACGVPRAHVHYLPNAVDVDLFRPAASGERDVVRREQGWPPDVFLWLYTGRLSEEKGVLDLLEAWCAVDLPGVLVLVGPDMPGHPMDAGPAVRKYVTDHSLASRVIVHGESTDVARLLRAADAYVQPSHYESFSNALTEAMASGLPVVASRVGGMLDAVRDGENGLLCAPRSASELASAMRQVMLDSLRAASLGQRARQTVVEQFSETVVMGRLAELLRGVVVASVSAR